MSAPSGKASHKKKDGILTFNSDQSAVTWAPVPGLSAPAVSILVKHITNLQQTPEAATKVILKILEKKPGTQGDPNSLIFTFTSPTDARAEANDIKDTLSRLMAAAKINDPSIPRPAAGNGVANNAEDVSSSASAVRARAAAASRLFDDSHLTHDIELQMSLMRKDKLLHQTYMDALASKPPSIRDATFNSQFWATRTGLLRSFAIENNQLKGAYNILPTMNPKSKFDEETGEEKIELNINLAEITAIFKQHPLVERVYNENVPKITEADFWSRFFLSRLFKQLKGERVLESDRSDAIFDKYDAADDHVKYTSRIEEVGVPHIIDLKGNVENQGGFKGISKDWDQDQRPSRRQPAIFQVLNATSGKLLGNVSAADRIADLTSTADEATFQNLSLQDLKDDVEVEQIILNIREQNRLANQASGHQNGSTRQHIQDPTRALRTITDDLSTLNADRVGGVDLQKGIGVYESDTEDDEDEKLPHVGSRASRMAAQKQITELHAQSKTEQYGHDADDKTPMGIPADLTQRCLLTNATTNEFLKQFWNAYLSGDPDRAEELSYHAESLKKSMNRIEAIAVDADAVRNKILDAKKKEVRDYYARTKTRIRFRPETIGGGAEAVMTLLGPPYAALGKAQALYGAALAAEGLALSTEAD